MRLDEKWHQADPESYPLSVRVIGELIQRELGIDTVQQLDGLAKGVGLHPASALDDPAWHIYVLAAAWAKHQHPTAGRDGWCSFGSLISELTCGWFWGDTGSEHWEAVQDRARGLVEGDQRNSTEQVFSRLEELFFAR